QRVRDRGRALGARCAHDRHLPVPLRTHPAPGPRACPAPGPGPPALRHTRGPRLTQPPDPAAALFDTSELDFSQIPGFIATAKAQSGITEPDSVIVIVDRSGFADASGVTPGRAVVSLDSPYEDATVQFDMVTGQPLA